MTSPLLQRCSALRARWAVLLMVAVIAAPDLAHVADASAAVAGAESSLAAGSFVAPAASASVRLADGRYLVVGGCAPGHCQSVITAAEIYDPGTGQVIPTGSTLTPHGYATLTLLPSGKALLAGGCSGRLCGSLNPDAEVWNPGTGRWTATGTMLGDAAAGSSPEHASAVLLASGQVLVAGGVNYSPVAQVWNPSTGTWRATSPMRAPRESFTLTTLGSGLVLAAGGCDYYYCETVLESSELFHPATGTWTATGTMVQARYGAAATRLSTGQVQVTGGTTTGGTAATVTELYNPRTGVWAGRK